MIPNDATRAFHVKKKNYNNNNQFEQKQRNVSLQVLHKVSLTFSNCFLHNILSLGHVISAGPEQHPDGRSRVFTQSRATHVMEELYLLVQKSQDLLIFPLKYG